MKKLIDIIDTTNEPNILQGEAGTKTIFTQGGRRINAGRKPVVDKKIAVVVYINKSVVNALGEARVKASAHEHISRMYEAIRESL